MSTYILVLGGILLELVGISPEEDVLLAVFLLQELLGEGEMVCWGGGEWCVYVCVLGERERWCVCVLGERERGGINFRWISSLIVKLLLLCRHDSFN